VSDTPQHEQDQPPPKSDKSQATPHQKDGGNLQPQAPDLRPLTAPAGGQAADKGKAQVSKSNEAGSGSTTTVDSSLNSIARSRHEGSADGTVPNTTSTQVQSPDGTNTITFEEEPADTQKGGKASPPTPGATSENKPAGEGSPGHAKEEPPAPATNEANSGKPSNGMGKQNADTRKTGPKEDGAKEPVKGDKSLEQPKTADGTRPRTLAPDLRKAPSPGPEKGALGPRSDTQGKGNVATERQQALGQLDSVMDPERTRGRAFLQKLERDLASFAPNALDTSRALAALLYEKKGDGSADTFKYHLNPSKLDDLRLVLQLTKSDADKLTGLVKPPDRPLYMGEGGRLGSAASINEAEATGKIMAVLQAESTLGMGFALETILAGGTADQVRAASDLGSALTGVAGSVAGAAGARDANAGVGRAATEDKAARARQTSETRGRTAEAPKPNAAAGGPDLNISGTGRGASWNVSLNIDEPLAVGERGISPAESMRRATDLRNRQFLDFMTNQGTKREFPEVPSPAKGAPDLSSTSVKENPSSLITRPSLGGIKEWDELSAIVLERSGPSLSGKTPQQAKEVLNRAIREELKDPKTAPGRAISDALVNQLGMPREELFAKRRAGE
jgi:hypothetical protein